MAFTYISIPTNYTYANINSLNSVGTNNLIKDGAILVNNYNDICRILSNDFY